MLGTPEAGLSTNRLIIAVGQNFTRRIKETTGESVQGRMTEEKAFWLAYGTATRQIDLAINQYPTFDLNPAIRFTINYFREKNKGYFLSWLAKLKVKQTSEGYTITPGAARLLEEAKRRQIYPPRRR